MCIWFVNDQEKKAERKVEGRFGTPMGSPLSLLIANIVLQNLEMEALSKLPFTIPVYFG